jgi:hypothetical protein
MQIEYKKCMNFLITENVKQKATHASPIKRKESVIFVNNSIYLLFLGFFFSLENLDTRLFLSEKSDGKYLLQKTKMDFICF